MKKILLFLSLLSVTLSASIGSSINIPTAEHLKYTFGNHKHHPVQKMEKERYLRTFAPLSMEQIQKSLEAKGYTVTKAELKDIASELVYEVYAKSSSTNALKLYIDPKTAAVLKEVRAQ